MAASDLNLDSERLRAELAKLKAETELLEAQNRKARAETDAKLQVEISKMIAETAKISRETRWYPVVAASAVMAASVAALGVIVVKLIHG
jgi:multidrug resistance efflux pump